MEDEVGGRRRRRGPEHAVGSDLNRTRIDVGVAGVAVGAGEDERTRTRLHQVDGTGVVGNRRGNGERRGGVVLGDEELGLTRDERAAREARGRGTDGRGDQEATGLEVKGTGQGQRARRGGIEAQRVDGRAAGDVGRSEDVGVRAGGQGAAIRREGGDAGAIRGGEACGPDGEPTTEDTVGVTVGHREAGVRARVETERRADRAADDTRVEQEGAICARGQSDGALGSLQHEASEGLRVELGFATENRDWGRVQGERARRRQDVVDRRESITAILNVDTRILCWSNRREIQRQAALEDARAADIGIGRTERERAETLLRQATVRRVRGDCRRCAEGRTSTTREEDRRGRGVARPRIRHRDTGDLAGGFIEDRDGRGTDTTATDELDQRSADIIGTHTRKGDAANARTVGTGKDGLNADGETVRVHRHTTGVDGRGPDPSVDEVILRGDGAEDAVVGVNERDTVRRPDGELAELDRTAVANVKDREFS